MGPFHVIPEVVAVAADRLVVIVRIGTDGSVVVRVLANSRLSTIAASELSAPPTLSDSTAAPLLSLVQATDVQRQRARRFEAVIAKLLFGVVFACAAGTERRLDVVTGIPQDLAAMLLNQLGEGGQHTVDHCLQFLGIDAFDELCRARDVPGTTC